MNYYNDIYVCARARVRARVWLKADGRAGRVGRAGVDAGAAGAVGVGRAAPARIAHLLAVLSFQILRRDTQQLHATIQY